MVTNSLKNYFLVCIATVVLAVLIAGCQPKEEVGTGAAVKVVEAPVKKPITGPDIIFLAHEIKILGKEGFDNPQLKVKAGDKVIWTNNIPEQKDVVLTIQKDSSKEFVNSGLIISESEGGFWEHTFEEVGNYTYWTVGYGVKARIIVE